MINATVTEYGEIKGTLKGEASVIGSVRSTGDLKGSTGGMKVLYTDSYAIALANGFEGTVEQWLESLKGEKGDPGAPGKDGEPGQPGKDGAPGAKGEKGDKGDTGATGSQGPKGDKGDTGATGSQGPKGDKGDKGDTGAQGIQGIQGIQGNPGAKGDKGDKGDTGNSGVYIGSGTMPADCNVQIDPNGDAFTSDELVQAVLAALPVYDGSVVSV